MRLKCESAEGGFADFGFFDGEAVERVPYGERDRSRPEGGSRAASRAATPASYQRFAQTEDAPGRDLSGSSAAGMQSRSPPCSSSSYSTSACLKLAINALGRENRRTKRS